MAATPVAKAEVVQPTHQTHHGGFRFAPIFTTEIADSSLQTAFQRLTQSLRWENISSELEKAEADNVCYLRLRVDTSPTSGTYAGYPAGSPLKVPRSNPQEKRAYFVRHYIRSTLNQQQQQPLPSASPSSYISLAADGKYLMLKIPIDRPLDLGQTFYSHDFGTWMFYVARIDAILNTLPNIRIALSIERTISPQERKMVDQLHPNKLSRHPTNPPTTITTTTTTTTNITTTATTSSILPRVKSTGTFPSRAKPIAAAITTTGTGGHVSTSISPSNLTLVRPTAPSLIVPSHSRSKNRLTTQKITTSSSNVVVVGGGSGNVKMMNSQTPLWEELFSTEYYKPLFLYDDENFNRKAARSWVVPDGRIVSDTMGEYWRLRNMVGCNIPEWVENDGRVVGNECGDDFIVNENEGKNILNEKMNRALRAAIDYNVELECGRRDLKEWFVEDQKMEVVRREAAKESEPDSSSET